MKIRQATPEDMPAIDRMIRPEVVAGRMLPRSTEACTFLVATVNDTIVGAVALKPLTNRVAELCSLIANRRGMGVGRRLVESLVARADALGYEEVVALTEATRFFTRCAFEPIKVAPWQVTHRRRRSPFASALREATDVKAKTCRACTRRPACSQTFVNLSLRKRAA